MVASEQHLYQTLYNLIKQYFYPENLQQKVKMNIFVLLPPMPPIWGTANNEHLPSLNFRRNKDILVKNERILSQY